MRIPTEVSLDELNAEGELWIAGLPNVLHLLSRQLQYRVVMDDIRY